MEPTSNRIQHFNQPSSSSGYIPRRQRHKSVPRKQTEYVSIRDEPTPHHYIGGNPPLPVVDIAQIVKRALHDGRRLDHCAKIPVDQGPAKECAHEVQKQIISIRKLFDQIDSEIDSKSQKDVLSALSRTYPYTPDNFENVGCDEFEDWANKCNRTLRDFQLNF